GLPRGARVRVKLGAIDEITLDVFGTVIERLDTEVLDASGTQPADEAEDDEEDIAAGPISIAVDIDEPQPDAEPAPAAAA
ncbi:MAG: ribonuclease, partial [Polaromonas sp.]|nr:ribonuclease [Polaromonas sp.]